MVTVVVEQSRRRREPCVCVRRVYVFDVRLAVASCNHRASPAAVDEAQDSGIVVKRLKNYN